MATYRPMGHEPMVIHLARGEIRGNQPRDLVVRDLQRRFPTVDGGRIIEIVDREVAAWERVQNILTRNLGQFTNVARVLDCPNSQRMRVSLRLNVEDATTGEVHPYSHVVELPSAGRLRGLLEAAITSAIDEATEHHYHALAPSVYFAGGGGGVEFVDINCIPGE